MERRDGVALNNDIGHILAEEHASKLVEKAQNNFERIFKAKPTVIGDGWNKAVVYDDQEKIGITWINIERYEMQTEVRIE